MSNVEELKRRIGRTLRVCDVGIMRSAESLLTRAYPEEIEMPIVAICGPPRSGHTLTYQLITQGLKVFCVDNFQYMFYRTPLMGYLLSKIFCRPYVSEYRSNYGYINGLNGPQQAYLIWKYWCDMDRNERPPKPDPARLRKFGKVMNKLYKLDRRPHCSSWLGHAFYLEELQTIFKHNIIIWTKRDLISTGISLLKLMRRESEKHGHHLVSSRPRECQDHKSLAKMSVYQRAALQIYFFARRMDEHVASGHYAIFESSYANLCNNPRGFPSALAIFAKTKGIVLQERTDTQLPAHFIHRKAFLRQNEDTKKLGKAFQVLFDKYGPVSVSLEPE